ncbi:MAG: NlpC/P60 family protein, partial [bacterium]
KKINVDIIRMARKCVGKGRYLRRASIKDAPAVFNCASFPKWLYSQIGIWLPKFTVQQREMGESVGIDAIQAGDLLFFKGNKYNFIDNASDGVGHVAIATSEGSIIHCIYRKIGKGVFEHSVSSFVNNENFRGARRIIPDFRKIITLITPSDMEVETSDDIKWIILQNL